MKKAADKIKRVGLIGNPDKVQCGRVVAEAARLINAAGRRLFTEPATASLSRFSATVCGDVRALAREVDLLLVLGGDGTMLRVARETAGVATPLLGINIGGLGFLTAVPSDKIKPALNLIWAGGFKFERRALIEATTGSGAKKIQKIALNDIVIGRGEVARLIDLEVAVNAEPLTRYRCDGLIVSSPTGSTAYSLAAGGAVLLPTAEVFALTPICPHTLSNRSLIVPLSATIRIKPVSSRTRTILSADGEIVAELAVDEVVTVRRSKHSVKLMHLAHNSFFEALRRKLQWRGAYL